MIYITGDTHGYRERFTKEYLPMEKELGKEDYIIVCGDFGFIFTLSRDEERFLDKLAKKPYTICFVDGNHENFHGIYKYPREIWNGGQIHRIRKNIVHLCRGQVFTLCGKRIFTMGGAYSMDRCMRTLNLSYWLEEIPDNCDYREATSSLREVCNKVDIILTHTAPRRIIRRMGMYPDEHDAELTGYLDYLMDEVDFGKWYFGHWHRDERIGDKFRAVHYDVIKIED